MNVVIKIIIFTLLGVFTGCASTVPLKRTQVSEISREVSSAELDRILGNATVLSQVEVRANNRDYFVRNYKLQTGIRSETSVICTPICIPVITQVPVTAEYVIIQNLPNRTVFAWGTLEELSKDPDTSVNSIMPVVKQKLVEAQKQ